MESKVSNGILFAYWQNRSQSHEAWIFFLAALQIGKQLLQIELIFLGDRIFLAMHLGHDFVDAWLGSFNSFHIQISKFFFGISLIFHPPIRAMRWGMARR